MNRLYFCNFLLIVSFVLFFAARGEAQFSSGSTGADGALDLSSMNCLDGICQIQLPESGVFNFTTVNVPLGKELRFTNNSRNTPVTILAQGQVAVAGVINVSSIIAPYVGSCAPGILVKQGNGGFRGGGDNHVGFGPGGGTEARPYGVWIGPLSLFPLTGGSGAFLASGSGGGAIAIVSSASILISGQVRANGAAWNPCNLSDPASGSGGAIRLVSNTINASGLFQACGTQNNCGVVRLEATSLSFTGTSSPAAVLSVINTNILSTTAPLLTIATVGGFAVPTYSGTRFDTVDLLLPNQIPDPVDVGVSAANIPTGTQVQVGLVSGAGTSTPCNLTGSLASSSCTATIANLNRTAVTYLLATAAFDPPGFLGKYNPNGPNQVAKIILEAVPGTKTKYIFLSSAKKVIKEKMLQRNFLQFFGM